MTLAYTITDIGETEDEHFDIDIEIDVDYCPPDRSVGLMNPGGEFSDYNVVKIWEYNSAGDLCCTFPSLFGIIDLNLRKQVQFEIEQWIENHSREIVDEMLSERQDRIEATEEACWERKGDR